MNTQEGKVILVTGSSTGIGRLTVESLARQGHRVYASMRDIEGRNEAARRELADLSESAGLTIRVIELDVTEDESVARAIEAVIDAEGRLDVVVNNAGVMNVGISEGYTLEQLQQQFEVNFFGSARTIREALPHMRAQGEGLLIQVTSLFGRLVFPFFGAYCASKFAAEAMAEAYHYELSPLGIDSVIVEPGPFPSRLIPNSPSPDGADRVRDYGELAQQSSKFLDLLEAFYASEQAPDPQVVAEAIVELVAMPAHQRPVRTVAGLDYGVRQVNKVTAPLQRALLDELGSGIFDLSAKAVS